MKNAKESKNTYVKNTHVPDKVYAYMIQSHHMLYELLKCQEGDMVSVEVFDDVGVEREDGSKEAIQLKSATSNRNPVSDRAVDLWKTLYNWLRSVEEGELDLNCVRFILFITVNKEGTIVNSFNLAKNYKEAIIAWDNAKQIFYDKDGKLKETGEEYKKYIEYFFSEEKKELASKIISKFELKRCIENYTTTVKKEFYKFGIPVDIVEPIYTAIIGWIDRNVVEMVETGQSIVIFYEDYQKQLWALIREYNQKHSLMTHSIKPSNQEVQQEIQKQRTYIEQLDIIDCEYIEKVEAINDYLRAAVDRAIWADNGEISLQNMQTYEERLKRSWNNQKKIVMIEKKGESPIEQGQLIYYKCQNKKIDMDAVTVPDFFQSGCYHALSDELEIGWHPQYLNKIERKK